MIADPAEALGVLSLGPVQILLIGFAHPDFHGRIRLAVDFLTRNDEIRIIDRAVVRRDADGKVQRVDALQTDLGEVGALVDALVACDENDWIEEQVERHGGAIPGGSWFIEERLPPDCAALVLVIEHRWARGLQNAVIDAGGFHLADAWIHPVDLAVIGFRVAGAGDDDDAHQELASARARARADLPSGTCGGLRAQRAVAPLR